MPDEYTERFGLLVQNGFGDLVEEMLPPVIGDRSEDVFWSGFADLVLRHAPRNAQLLERRATLQKAIDEWHMARRGDAHDPNEYREFLTSIGYLESVPEGVRITTEVADSELSDIAGPQLVVPLTNARYALNAANARYGSLYDALYGTDVLGDPPPSGPYDEARGNQVVAWGRSFLDEHVPLVGASHRDVIAYRVVAGQLEALSREGAVGLLDPGVFVGFEGNPDAAKKVWLRHHGLHIVVNVDRTDPIGKRDDAGVCDIELEAAVTVIMDGEDSVAVVDPADKLELYRNWLGIVRGDLTAPVRKDDEFFDRRLASDRRFTGPDGREVVVPGTALLLVRNVGLQMDTQLIMTEAEEPVPEGIIDAVVTALCARAGAAESESARIRGEGSVHIVKPKLHGPDEVAATVELFADVERLLGLPAATLKLGLMDEERRTTLNLEACIAAASNRLVFVNTGFLDRTGDEIHTSMHAGPMLRKGDMKHAAWLKAYEDHNVEVCLAVGLPGRGQIGKGMWAAPDRMQEMLATKSEHPRAGANCAWVPSPTAATIHAIHYHQVDVAARQEELRARPRVSIDDLLAIPVTEPAWSVEQRQEELDNNLQGILGYVARWVSAGVGCSKVPDIHDVALMEDRATCRISSQHVANWLLHGIVTREEVEDGLRRMAEVVDRQNRNEVGYEPLAPNFDSPAFLAAQDLVLRGLEQPSGYTEPILHARRLEQKAMRAQ